MKKVVVSCVIVPISWHDHSLFKCVHFAYFSFQDVNELYCCVADSTSSDSAEDEPVLEALHVVANIDADDDDDSACGSSDVTFGPSDLELAADLWPDDFNSDATVPDDSEPFFDFE